jgi:hypothetical protein
MADNPRLTNLGVTSPSKAGSNVEATLGPDKLAALLESTIGLDKKIAETRDTPVPSAGKNMLSTGNIPMLALAALAAAIGGKGGQAAGLGALMGTMKGAENKTQSMEAQKAKQIDVLQDTVDRRRQTIATLLTAQPGLFMDAAGKDAIDPAIMGMAATGVPIPLSPASIVGERRRTAQQDSRIAFWTDKLKNATTPEMALQAGQQLSTALELNLSPDDISVMSTMDETSAWLNLADNSTTDTGSVLSAWGFAMQNGKTLTDPEVLKKIRPAAPTAGEVTLDDVAIGYLQKWQDAIKQNPELARLPKDQQIATIFADDPAGATVLTGRFKTLEGAPTYVDGSMIKDVMINVSNLENALRSMNPAAAEKLFGSPEHAAEVRAGMVKAQVGVLNGELASQHAARVGTIYSEIEEVYRTTYPDASPAEVSARALQVFSETVGGVSGDLTAPDFDIDILRTAFRKKVTAGLAR